MFTGIVEERGTVASVEPLTNAERIAIRGSVALESVRPGDSIAVNGVCLTVVEVGPDSFTADVMEETLKRSSLGNAGIGSEVNLERAARLDSRLGGHLVQGHVDGTGQVLVIEPDPHWTLMRISLPAGLGRYVVEKGSITVDGVSLTVVSVDDEGFSVSLIPTTLAETTLGSRRVGDTVNLEVDAIAKYVERLMQGRSS
ncbi:MAG: riboflavin synthase [Candidatus Nanopelagicales bacterium]|jgi:riboflavin synthase